VFRVAILSFWHVHAWDYAAEAEAHPGVEVVGVWDEEPGRGREEAERRGVRFYGDLDELLGRPEVDGVLVTTPTVAHRDVIPAAARAGKHVFTEKVIAPTLREAREIVAAVERAGVVFVVSLPRLYAGYTAAIARVLDRGLLGEVTHLRVRVSHDGALRTEEHPEGWLPGRFFDPEQSAGGVLIDFGAHPLYLLRRFLGMPEEASASYGHVTGRTVEDNAVVTFRYPGGAVGIAEASFVGAGFPFVVEVHGTRGSLLYAPDDGLRVRRTGESRWESVAVPPDGPTPFGVWVDHCLRGTPAPGNVRIATDLSALAEAANRSAAENRPVRF
jgi:1,5-anhydro-D-fructose reductase (1,5-anhydro-D-mannitol-forming)